MRRAHDELGRILRFVEQAQVSGVLLSAEKVLLRKDEFVDRLIDYLGLESRVTQIERQDAKDFITVDPVDYLDSSHIGLRELVGYVDHATPTFVAGWADVRNSPEPAELRISVNGSPAGSTTADLPRPDVKDRGFHPTGECGFRFVFPEGQSLQKGDEVAVQFAVSGEHLKWSPTLVESPAGSADGKDRASPMAECDPYLFVHLPKTAGTSFRLAVQRTFGGRVAYDYGVETPATSDLVRQYVYRQADLPALHERLRRDRIVMLGGHVPYERYASIFTPSQVITFLRDPVERIVSEYHHACRMNGFEGTLLKFAERPHHRNRQSAILHGVSLAAAGFVGVTEHYRLSLRVIRERLGWSLPNFAANQNPDRTELTRKYPLTAGEQTQLREWNKSDIALYEEAVHMLCSNES